MRKAARALIAGTAPRKPGKDYGLAGRKLDSRPDSLDDTGPFVAENGRAAGRRCSVDRVQVAVADPARPQANTDLPGPGRSELELLHPQGAIRPLQHGGEHGAILRLCGVTLGSVPSPPLEILFVSRGDVEEVALSSDDVLGAVEAALRAQGEGEVVLEPREHLVPDPAFKGHFNLLRAYVAPLDVAGVKVVGDYVDNWKLGLPSELALLTLYDPRTGVPRAIVDATEITERRTGAMTALGARHLARADSRILGHVGARGTAFSNVTMLDHLFDFEEIRVTSRRPESRKVFARRLEQALGKPVHVVDTWREVVEGADIVVEASRLGEPEPLLRTEWIGDGTLTIPYGTMSAVELSLTSIMDKVVVDDWGQCKQGRFGSLRAHVDAGLLTEETLHAELAEIMVGRKPGRERDDERILFWHRGLATTDIAVGNMIYERARERGLGTSLRYR
jgi:ornithine cyclodeaminase